MKKKCLSLGLAAVLLISPALHALPLADSVISFTGGSGFGIDDGTPDIEPGTYYADAVTALDGIILALGGAMGTPGTITMRFTTGEVVDGAGPDLRLYDTFSFQDGFSLDISADGSNFTNALFFVGDLGIVTCSPESPCITDADISGTGLGAISYLRITAAGNSAQGWPEAYTLDAVEALNFRAFQVYEPGTLALLAAAALALALVRHRKS